MESLSPAVVRAHLARLTKPPGSLGRLEDLGTRLASIQGTLRPVTRPRRMVLFAGDHGVVASGTSAWPASVTRAVVELSAEGRSAGAVLAAGAGCELEIVDVACVERPRAHPRIRTAALAAGTRNLAHEPAMTRAAWRAAFELGAERARQAARDGVRVAIAGEVGIGNTTAASALAALLLEVDAEQVVGRGAGADAAQLARKVAAVRSGVDRARGLADPEAKMAAVGGFEIAAMAGFQAECATQRIVLLLDGTIATAALLCAEALRPGTRRVCIAAHRSPEPAHARMLQHLDLEAHLDWGLCLGEGTGALLVLPLLDAAASILRDMATFDDLGVAVP